MTLNLCMEDMVLIKGMKWEQQSLSLLVIKPVRLKYFLLGG